MAERDGAEKNMEKQEIEIADPVRTEKKVAATMVAERVLTENSDAARLFYEQSRFGAISRQRVRLTFIEALYLFEKGKLDILDKRDKVMSEEQFVRRAEKMESNFWIKYCVFKDLRNRGYIVKTALKFGADFRVYERGVKPGEDHAKWIVYPVHEGSTMTWYEFSAKNRVAHSTKKRLLVGVVDEEDSVTYYEINWVRP